MKNTSKQTYRSDLLPNGERHVYRVTEHCKGPWYRRKRIKIEKHLGHAVDIKGVKGLINRDIIALTPNRVVSSSNFDSAGNSTGNHGW